MSSATKQKSSAGKNVLIFFIVFIILEMLIVVGVGRVFKNKNVTPSIAGYSLYIMNGDGMGDRVPDGALVITSNMTPSTDKIGEAVVCENVPDIVGPGRAFFERALVRMEKTLSPKKSAF